MNFSGNDFREFTFDDNRLTCTAGFVKPVHIVMMSTVHNYTDRSVMFSNSIARNYASNMSYIFPLEINTVDGLNHSKAIKLKDVFDDDSQVYKVMSIFQNNNYLDAETNNVLELILAEIFQNFYAHADFDQPPICCVQDWPSSPFLEISIADKGIGIGNSLQQVLLEHPSGTNPCRLACERGISCSLNQKSKIGTTHEGYGLFFTKQFIEQNSGILHILSGNQCYINSNNRESDEIIPYTWNGTVIRLIINKYQCVHSEQFFKTVGKEIDGDDYEEFF